MAEKDLVYYKQGIPAGHQMDKYSANPGCLFSKNVDIFSSSNSYKATAFTEPTAQDNDIVDVDGIERMILKTNGDIVDTWDNNRVITNCMTRFSSVTLPINYEGRDPTASHLAEFGTPKRLIVKYEGDEWKTIVVYSDRTKYIYSNERYKADWEIVSADNCTAELADRNDGGKIVVVESTEHVTNKTMTVILRPTANGHSSGGFWISGLNWQSGDVIRIVDGELHTGASVTYDAEFDRMIPTDDREDLVNDGDGSISGNGEEGHFNCNRSGDIEIRVRFRYTSLASNPDQTSQIIIQPAGEYNEYWEFLPIDDDRIIKDIGEYYFTPGKTQATLLNFRDEWFHPSTTHEYQKNTRYYFEEFMAYSIDPAMKAVDCVVFDEKVYLICNKDGNGYIFPCDLTGGKGTPYIAYGVEFKSAIVLNYLIYLVGENRGVSTLFVYSGTELVHIIEGNKKANGLPDYIDNDEQYLFNGMIADWRGLLVLGTTDNRIFCYGQTFGGRGGSFIHSLADGQTLKEIRTIGKDLYIKYTETETSGGVETTVLKTIKYQNDVAIKNYNTDFEIVYPVIIGSHMIEKEVYDLYCSYILPSSDCSLEFWLAVNHYYFWTFRLPSKPTIAEGDEYFLSGATGTNVGLTFIEKDSENGEWYTFRLSKNLPVQNSYLTANMKLYKPVTGGANIEVAYTEFNHFKKIGEITAEGYKEGYDRFNNINTKNGFPRTHSLQLMVRGKGTANYSPEVFGIDLDANQRNRG